MWAVKLGYGSVLRMLLIQGQRHTLLPVFLSSCVSLCSFHSLSPCCYLFFWSSSHRWTLSPWYCLSSHLPVWHNLLMSACKAQDLALNFKQAFTQHIPFCLSFYAYWYATWEVGLFDSAKATDNSKWHSTNAVKFYQLHRGDRTNRKANGG